MFFKAKNETAFINFRKILLVLFGYSVMMISETKAAVDLKKFLSKSCVIYRPNLSTVKLFLYNNATKNPVIVDPKDPSGIDLKTPLVIITHGWMSSATNPNVIKLRDAYLREKNVILVDWSYLAKSDYFRSHCVPPSIAELIANLLCNQNSTLKTVHLVGHSLGAHLSGFVGKIANEICSLRVGRITGLDPAGPLYETSSSVKRLIESDAMLVECVHSNMGVAGIRKKCGTVDYYLNCGTFQPSCGRGKEYNLFDAMTCDHARSATVWSESVNSNRFKAKSCQSCPNSSWGICRADTENVNYFSMGQLNPARNSYFVPTNGGSPFAQGCGAYPSEPCL